MNITRPTRTYRSDHIRNNNHWQIYYSTTFNRRYRSYNNYIFRETVILVILLFILLLLSNNNKNDNKNNDSNRYNEQQHGRKVPVVDAWTMMLGPVVVVVPSTLHRCIQNTFQCHRCCNNRRIVKQQQQQLLLPRAQRIPYPLYRSLTTTTSAISSSSTTTTGEGSRSDNDSATDNIRVDRTKTKTNSTIKNVVIIGGGWGGLSTAHALSKYVTASKEQGSIQYNITIIESSKRVGGLVQDGYTTINSTSSTTQKSRRIAEAGMHGFWNNYYNIYSLLYQDLHSNVNVQFNIHTALTKYQEQGQYSPNGLQAIWPIYRDQPIHLPTGIAQAIYTRFINIPIMDLISAIPLITIVFADFDDSIEAWEKYDSISFYDLCKQYGVSQRCYNEIFESMILTGLFAPGTECSAAAAIGMAYFFVLQNQYAFDVQWCRGNIGTIIFDPWIQLMKQNGVHILYNTRVTGFQFTHTNDNKPKVTHVICTPNKNNNDGDNTTTQLTTTTPPTTTMIMEADEVVFAVGAKALNTFARYCPELINYAGNDFCKFANLRGTSVLATRIYLDRIISIPYTANACWGFDDKIGMTVFDIRTIHGSTSINFMDCPGSVIEVDYYHSSSLLVLSNDAIIAKVKKDLDILFGPQCMVAKVIDAAIVRLPEAVNWYFPGSYRSMPNTKSESVSNIYFAGDIVRTRHGSWSQEKAYVTGIEVANQILQRPITDGIIPLQDKDERHVQLSRSVLAVIQKKIGIRVT